MLLDLFQMQQHTGISTVVLCTWASCMKLAGYYAVGRFCTPPQTESVVLLPPMQISCLPHLPPARLKFSQTIHKGTLVQVNNCTKVYSEFEDGSCIYESFSLAE